MHRIKIFTFFVLLVLTSFIEIYAEPVPDTGQTGDYTNTYGEDSDYTINPPSYTKLGADGVELPDTATRNDGWIMTRDNVTGLVWEMKTDDGSIHDKNKTYTWCDTNLDATGGNQGICGDGTDTEDFIAALNSSGYGGYNDWRLPTARELISILDYGMYNPAVNASFFPDTISSGYWSSNDYANFTGFVWVVNFLYGSVSTYDKMNPDSPYYVRAVRGVKTQSTGPFIDNGDGTVTDTATGLMWQQQDDGTTRTWENALSYAEDLELAGYNDWRLPSVRELASVVDFDRDNPAIDSTFFHGAHLSYWSSSAYVFDPDRAFRVLFTSGNLRHYNKLDSYYVRAVRGGQNRLSGNLVISAPLQGTRWNVGVTQTVLWDTLDLGGNVSIALSRDGGKNFSEIISDSFPNNGSFEWMATEPASSNCVLRIEPLADPSKFTIQGLFTVDQLVITTTSIPNALQDSPYTVTLAGQGGSSPFIWSTSDGSLPEGLALNAATGIISGKSNSCGDFDFSVHLNDSSDPPMTADMPLSLGVICSDDYTIEGTVTRRAEAVLSDETLLCNAMITGGYENQTISDDYGIFSFQHLKNGTYTITPEKPGYAFDPASITVENMKRNTSVSFEMYRLFGDIDGDGMVTLKDGILALKILSCVTPGTVIYPVACFDGKVEIKDVISILQKSGEK